MPESTKRKPGGGRKSLGRIKNLPRITDASHALLVAQARAAKRTVAGQIEYLIHSAARMD